MKKRNMKFKKYNLRLKKRIAFLQARVKKRKKKKRLNKLLRKKTRKKKKVCILIDLLNKLKNL